MFIGSLRTASNWILNRSSEGADLPEMNEANNNAIDLLLRSLARGEREHAHSGTDPVSLVGSDSAMASDHLDADELSLYAEGVLAPPTKARYTAHLADCDRCRTMVVGLAQAAGLTVQREPVVQQGGRSFWQSFVTIFSLPVLRYALPAILLTGILAIGLLAWRQQAGTEFVAMNKQEQPAAVLEQRENTVASVAPGASPLSIQEQQEVNERAQPVDPKKVPPAESGVLNQKPVSNSAGVTLDGTSQQDVAKAGPVAGAGVAQPVYAPEPASPPAPPRKVAEESEGKWMARKEEYRTDREAAQRGQDDAKLAAKDDSPRHGPARSRSITGGVRRDEDSSLEDRAPATKDKKADPEEPSSHTVSGRTFRRSGNAWIDTAYTSSRSVTNVGRGTEQFRSLMADEPGLRAIVQQLSGEVIVVWKSRTYRFR